MSSSCSRLTPRMIRPVKSAYRSSFIWACCMAASALASSRLLPALLPLMALLGTLTLDVSAERAAASFVESALISVLAPVRAVLASDSWSCSSSALPSLSSSCCRRRWDSFASSVWAASWALSAAISSLAARSRREAGQSRSGRAASEDPAHCWPFPPIASLVCHNCALLPKHRPLADLDI